MLVFKHFKIHLPGYVFHTVTCAYKCKVPSKDLKVVYDQFVSSHRTILSLLNEEERDEFWNDLSRCVDGLSTRNYVVVLGDLNARVGDGEVEGVVGKYGVPGENESGER